MKARATPTWWTATRIAQLTAAALFVAAGLFIALVPLGTAVSESSTPTVSTVSEVSATTLADDVGWYGVFGIAALPILLAVGPMLLPGRWHTSMTVVAAAVACLLCVLALASVGFFYFPGVVALVIAAALLRVRPRRRRG